MRPNPHLWLCAFTTTTLWPELTVSMGSWPHLSFCACKTACLAPKIRLAIGPSLHLWFCAFKTANLDQNNWSLWVPALICGFFMQNSAFRTRLQVYVGARHRLLICECKTACLDPEWRLSIDPSLHLWFCAFKTATLASDLLVSMCPSPHLWFLHAKQRF